MENNIYDSKFVSTLFDKMSKSYGRTNYLSSFGFTEIWRKRCIHNLNLNTSELVGFDLMSGMGEIWLSFNQRPSKLFAIDISEKMIIQAELVKGNFKFEIQNVQQDILKNDIESELGDFVVSSFGLKTFNEEQLEKLAIEVNRILKPGGHFSFVEISEPSGLLKPLYMFYLNIIIPIIGWFFMGNDNSYRYLGQYCKNFRNVDQFKKYLDQTGMKTETHSFFFGCATGVSGKKSL